jgi:hypothetical protein
VKNSLHLGLPDHRRRGRGRLRVNISGAALPFNAGAKRATPSAPKNSFRVVPLLFMSIPVMAKFLPFVAGNSGFDATTEGRRSANFGAPCQDKSALMRSSFRTAFTMTLC